jgi:hypothetical protein
MYEGEPVNRSQMDIKSKTCDIRTWKKTFISRNILHQHWYTCPIVLPVRRDPQHRSVLSVVSATSAPGRASSATFERPWANVSSQLWTAYAKNISHRKEEHIFINIFCIESSCTQETHNRTLLFCSRHPKHGRLFGYWNQPLNMRMRVSYLDYHRTGLYCYLVVHRKICVHYSCFTSICDLFTDFSSYKAFDMSLEA